MPFENITRRDFRSVTSRAGGDMIAEGTATAGGSGTLTDTNQLLFQATDDIKGCFLYIYEGPGGGTIPDDERYVSTSSTSSVATVSPNFSATPTTASKYEIHRRWRVQQWNDALDVALRVNRLSLRIPMRDESMVGVGSQRNYIFPADVHSINKIEWLPSGSGQDTRLGTVIEPWEWEWSLNNSGTPGVLLRFIGNDVPADGSKIIIHGQKFADIPTVDSDILEVATVPLRYHVLSQFFLARGMEGQANINLGLFERAIGELSPGHPENTRIIQAN